MSVRSYFLTSVPMLFVTPDLQRCGSMSLTLGSICRGVNGECETDPMQQNCSMNGVELYRAEKQNCMRYKTRDCGNQKKKLAVASTTFLMVSILSSSVGHLLCMLVAHGHISTGNCVLVCLFGIWGAWQCVFFPLWMFLMLGEYDGDPERIDIFLLCVLGSWSAGLIFNLVVGVSHEEPLGQWEKRASFFLQIPVVSAVVACTMTPDTAKDMAKQRAGFKVLMWVVQDIPNLSISAVDAWFFGWTIANRLVLCTSLAELLLWLLPLLMCHMWAGTRSLCQHLGMCIPCWNIQASMRFCRGCLRSLWNAVASYIWSSWSRLVGWRKGLLPCWVDIKDPADSAADNQQQSQSQS